MTKTRATQKKQSQELDQSTNTTFDHMDVGPVPDDQPTGVDMKCYRGGCLSGLNKGEQSPSHNTTTPETISEAWLNRAVDERRLTVPLRPAFAYLDDEDEPQLRPDCRFVSHDVVLMSKAQMQHAAVLAAGAPLAQVLACIALDLRLCRNGDVSQLAERPRRNNAGHARVEREPGRQIEMLGTTRWPNTIPTSCLVLHDTSPSGILRRLHRIEREALRRALMDGSVPFGGWDNAADAAFDAEFDCFEATMPDEAAVSDALNHLENTKAIYRSTHRDLVVSPQRLMQANPAIAGQLQTFLRDASTNDGSMLFGQDIAAAVKPVPNRPKRNLTRKQRHIADRQELILQTDRADAAEARILELEQQRIGLVDATELRAAINAVFDQFDNRGQSTVRVADVRDAMTAVFESEREDDHERQRQETAG